LTVWIDGAAVGGVKSNRDHEFLVDAGSHQVWVSMDWCKSQPLSVVLSEGETVTLGVDIPKVLTSGIAILSNPEAFFRLARR